MSDSAQTGLGPETLTLIRDMVSDTEPVHMPEPRRAAPSPVHTAAMHTVAPSQAASSGYARRPPNAVLARVRAFRPSRRQIFWTVFALIVLLRPAWIVLTLVLGAFVTLGFGADRVWSGAVSLLKWYMLRAPVRGARLTARIDRFACRWDNLLDRFPDGWVDGLYLPDLQSLLDADDRHDAVMATRLQPVPERQGRSLKAPARKRS